jgi:hypothetical protein
MQTEIPKGKFLITNFGFGECLDVSLEGDCHEVEVTSNWELLVTFDMSFEGACQQTFPL